MPELIKIVAVGKLKQPGLLKLCEDYLVRMRPRWHAEVIECRDGKTQLVKLHQLSGTLILLDEGGRHFTTLEFTKALQELEGNARKPLVFAIGDAHGYLPEVRGLARQQWSLSGLTLPHLLARVVLLEQLYRAFTVISGHPYHHA